jgi:hypothetical protein
VGESRSTVHRTALHCTAVKLQACLVFICTSLLTCSRWRSKALELRIRRSRTILVWLL